MEFLSVAAVCGEYPKVVVKGPYEPRPLSIF